jgi:hypothetical protein
MSGKPDPVIPAIIGGTVGCAALLPFSSILFAALLSLLPGDDPDRFLPKHIGIAEVIVNDSASGFREGCGFFAYRMSPQTVMSLRQQGIGYLRGHTHPESESERNPFSDWMQTPLKFVERRQAIINGEARTLYALGASSGCSSGHGSKHGVQLPDLSRPGIFYSVTANREGMMIVDPRNETAFSLYFG